MKNFKILIPVLLMAFTFLGCNEQLVYDVVVENVPVISNFSPASGRQGTLINIDGENLQSVDSVTIGSGSATIKYRVNSTSMVVVVNSDSKSGTIQVANGAGTSQSSTDFTVLYPAPVITTFPATSKAFETIVIQGSNMDVVTAVSFDTAQAVITTQQEDLIEVLVPFYKELKSNIKLTYPTANGEAVVTSDTPFELVIVPPIVTNIPEDAPDSSEIVISGDDLYLVDSVLFGDKKGVIIEKGDTTMTVLVPQFPVTTTVDVSLYYFGNKLTATDNFQVQVATLAFWSDMTLYSGLKDGVATTDGVFFDAVSGKAYSPCEWDVKKDKVHFFITVEDGKVRITAQDLDGSRVDNFSCSGTPLTAEKTPNPMRLKRLNASDADEKGLIDQVKNQTLEELNSAVLADLGIGNASQTYLQTEHFLFSFAVGDVVLFQQFNDETLSFVEYTGAFEITSLNISADGTEASMTFNAYFGAY